MNWVVFVETLLSRGLEYFGLYYGIYRAQVQEIDEDDQARVKVTVPSLGKEKEKIESWAYPCVPFAGNGHGAVFMPEKKDWVWLVFEGGNLSTPIYMGGWYAEQELPAEFQGKLGKARGFRSKSGSHIMIDDEAEEVRVLGRSTDDNGTEFNSYISIRAKDKEIIIQTDGGDVIYLADDGIKMISQQGHWTELGPNGIALVSNNGHTVNLADTSAGQTLSIISSGDLVLQASGSVHLKGGTVKFNAGNNSAVSAEELIKWLATHTHPTAAPGPPSPPVPPPFPNIVIPTVKGGV